MLYQHSRVPGLCLVSAKGSKLRCRAGSDPPLAEFAPLSPRGRVRVTRTQARRVVCSADDKRSFAERSPNEEVAPITGIYPPSDKRGVVTTAQLRAGSRTAVPMSRLKLVLRGPNGSYPGASSSSHACHQPCSPTTTRGSRLSS